MRSHHLLCPSVLVRIMAEENIPLRAVRQHHSWSLKHCPARLRSGTGGITWAEFLAMVANPTPAPAPAPRPAPVKNSAAVRAYAPGEVKAIQGRLYAAGFYDGDLDDDYGPLTLAAVRAYQRAQVYPTLVADGDWGPRTQAHYDWVVRLQTALNGWSAVSPKLRTDGSIGGVTIAAVRRVMVRNPRLYLAAFRHFYRTGRPVNDGIPGPVFCRMISIPTHPYL